MEPKKNPKADVGRNSSLYFVIGLALVMLLVWRGLEWEEIRQIKRLRHSTKY